MTRKDYRLAAKNILEMPTKSPREKVMLVVFFVRTFSHNENFDYVRFIQTAGVTQSTIDIYENDFNVIQSIPTTLKYFCDTCGEDYKLVPPQKPFKCKRRGCKGTCA